MSNILQFNNQEFGELTVIEKDGEFFFLGKEVAEMLGYVNSRKAIYDHVDEEDKGVTKWNTLGGLQNVSIINESGLYSLILSSKLPQAKKFKNWVTKEVLPSIRKHGGYIRGQENLSNEELLAQAILVANNVIAEKTQRIKELEPKANYYDKLVDKNLLTNFRNTAKELHLPQKVFIDFLIKEKYIYRDKKGRLLPYSHRNKGYFEIKEWYREDNSLLGIQTMITPKGRKYFLILLGGGLNCD
ncbi:BRO family protein [Facklamia sp. P12955]|uniref:BRO family protein n=1 Tax=Facklamia sp. P12955 TaxID=3421946 RepID=UPI003D16B173